MPRPAAIVFDRKQEDESKLMRGSFEVPRRTKLSASDTGRVTTEFLVEAQTNKVRSVPHRTVWETVRQKSREVLDALDTFATIDVCPNDTQPIASGLPLLPDAGWLFVDG